MGAGSGGRFPSATALVPALALALFSFWNGTFYGGATAPAATFTWLSVLALGAMGVRDWRDPLRLGRAGRILPWAILVALGVSLLASQASRAGLVGIATLPAWLLLPAAIARGWRERAGARLGSTAIGLVVSGVAVTALLHWILADAPRPAMPLGHHNILAGWLVLTTPLALANTGDRGALRLAAGTAGCLGVVTILASGSLTALAALVVQLIVAWYLWRPARARRAGMLSARILAVVVMAAAAWRALPRLFGVVTGGDASLSARWTYLEAGWRGFLERPILGWGPGAVPWTLGRFLRPVAATNPASEIVGDLHSMPSQLAYETGLTGLLLVLALVAVFLLRRRAEVVRGGESSELARLGLVSLVGGLVFLLGSAAIRIPALAFTVALGTGACLTSASAEAQDKGPRVGLATLAYAAYLVVVIVLLLPATRAHLHYDRAVRNTDEAVQLAEVSRATALDPGFPLYALRGALLMETPAGTNDGPADPAGTAAWAAPGLAPLWLEAGVRALERDDPRAFDALLQAHRLDPLAPLPAFHLMRSRPEHPMAATWGARALAADPRLGAAVWWQDRPELWTRALEVVGRGAPETAAALAGAAASISDRSSGGTVLLALGMDRDRTVSFSLFAFRRRPWPASLAPVRLGVPFLEALGTGQATIPF